VDKSVNLLMVSHETVYNFVSHETEESVFVNNVNIYV